MKRQHCNFTCDSDVLQGTIDQVDNDARTGLIIVSGGNEIRSGAHAGQTRLSKHIATNGFPVMRFDRRGIGDSQGNNSGFRKSSPDIQAALDYFHAACPKLEKIAAFGNCDAATALGLFHGPLPVDGLILSNPWTLDEENTEQQYSDENPVLPPPSVIRSRYWQKLRDPHAIMRLLSGGVDLKKLVTGLKRASTSSIIMSKTTIELAESLGRIAVPTHILLARHDRTAAAFSAVWSNSRFKHVRNNDCIQTFQLDSASHSYADPKSFSWLIDSILTFLDRLDN